MSVTWKKYIWDSPRPAAPQEIDTIEQQWGVVLPEEYKDVAGRYQGMTPTPYVLDVERGNTTVCVLLTFTRDESRRTYFILSAYDVLKNHIPHGIYPFAMTGAGEYICFDYRDSPGGPKIVLVTVETDIYPIADSFSEFLLKLHD
jgi:hypothetical protein